MLTADELVAMRAVQASNLPDTATIRRGTRTSDGGGGHTTAWSSVATGIACRSAQQRQPVTVLQAGQEAVYADWIVTLAYGTDVRTEDEIQTSGRTLIVVGPVPGPWATAVRVGCVERR